MGVDDDTPKRLVRDLELALEKISAGACASAGDDHAAGDLRAVLQDRGRKLTVGTSLEGRDRLTLEEANAAAGQEREGLRDWPLSPLQARYWRPLRPVRYKKH